MTSDKTPTQVGGERTGIAVPGTLAQLGCET
jgi:hypothetical protein